MRNNTKIIIMLILENIVIVGCFIFLAWFFNYWWIVLFSLLILNTRIPTNGEEENKNDKK